LPICTHLPDLVRYCARKLTLRPGCRGDDQATKVGHPLWADFSHAVVKW
jgi:hypothetical protein